MFQFLKTKSGIIVLRTPQHFGLVFFLLICLFWLGNKILAMATFQILDGIQLLLLLLCCRSHRRTILLFQQITVCFFWTKLPSPGLVSQDFSPKWLAILYIPCRTLYCLWWGWPLGRGLMRGITISESGLGAHSETYTGKYRRMH